LNAEIKERDFGQLWIKIN